MKTLIENTATNSLMFKTSKEIEEGVIFVSIRLNDECNNGHQDFSITGDIYKSYNKSDRNHIVGGCIHEDIAKHFPEFKQFIKLHLSDYNGVPMHAVANGHYHLTNGFNNVKTTDKKFKEKFCEYYRLTPQQFKTVEKSYSKTHYAINLESVGVFDQWRREAQRAIETLEKLTGKEFLNDSTRSALDKPEAEAVAEEKQKIESGYYTPKARKEREKEALKKFIQDEKEELKNKIKELKLEQNIKLQVLRIAGKTAYKNCIYYNHSKTLRFNNWDWDRIDEETYNKIVKRIKLPEDVQIELKNI